jgi:hypothetical protein
LVKDKKFQENITLRLFQLLQNSLEKGFPGIKIPGLGMLIDRKPRVILEIAYLGEAILILFRQGRQNIPGQGIEGPALPAALFDKPPQFPGIGLGIKNNIKKTAEDGKHQDKKNPGQLIGGIFRLIENVETYQNTHHIQGPAGITGTPAGTGYKRKQKGQLYHQDENNKNPPPEYNPGPLFGHQERSTLSV